MTLFLTKINDDITNIEHRLFQSYRQLKKPERLKYRFKKDRVMHQIGDMLIQYCIEQCYGLNINQWKYHVTKNGKIEIQSRKHINVNLSYSFPYIVCAIDQHPVGVDIEEIKDLNYLNLATQFSVNEFNQVRQLKDFYTIWTKKESYTKLIGEGLLKGLDVYDVTQPLYYQDDKVFFQEYICQDRMIHLCSNHSRKHEIVKKSLDCLF